MSQPADTIMTFTARSPQRIISEGGSQAWKLNLRHAKKCTYLVCTQNAHNNDEDFEDATEAHGAAFLVGRISDFRRPDEGNEQDRWMIEISHYARINVPDAWDHLRYPVRYVTLSDLGIDADALDWLPMLSASAAIGEAGEGTVPFTGMLTIEQAKIGLAATFRVKPDAIDISVRY